VLLLSGSDLARTDAEVATVVSLAERDQSIVGLGIVGFDVSELGWASDRFAEHKEFLLRIVDTAMAGHRWDVLDYEPNCCRASPSFANSLSGFPFTLALKDP
jgi:hypothetical protein